MRQKSIKQATARKQRVASRKQKTASKDQTIESRIEQNLAEIRALSSELCRGSEVSADAEPAAIPPPNPVLAALIAAIDTIENGLSQFIDALETDEFLTGRERRRLIGVRSRNYGFISKSFEIAYDHPDFSPSLFNLTDMAGTMGILAKSRLLTELLSRFHRLSDDLHLSTCDIAFRDALRIYGNLRELNRSRVAGADVLFQELRQYFTLRRRNSSNGNGEPEPTEPTQPEGSNAPRNP